MTRKKYLKFSTTIWSEGRQASGTGLICTPQYFIWKPNLFHKLHANSIEILLNSAVDSFLNSGVFVVIAKLSINKNQDSPLFWTPKFRGCYPEPPLSTGLLKDWFFLLFQQSILTKLEIFTAHNAKCLSKTLEIIFLGNYFYLFQNWKAFLEKNQEILEQKFGKNRDLWVKKKYCAPPAPSFWQKRGLARYS